MLGIRRLEEVQLPQRVAEVGWQRRGQETELLGCWMDYPRGCLSYTNKDMINDREVNISQMHKPLMKLVVVAR